MRHDWRMERLNSAVILCGMKVVSTPHLLLPFSTMWTTVALWRGAPCALRDPGRSEVVSSCARTKIEEAGASVCRAKQPSDLRGLSQPTSTVRLPFDRGIECFV